MFLQSVTINFLRCVFSVVFILLQGLIRVNELWDSLIMDQVENSFDYVIVGGGSAGAVLAARLSEDPNVTVLLLEAGGYGFNFLDIPVLGPIKQLTELDWQHTTVPQCCSCLALENNASKWPSGKILGGSTHLNYMIYLRGHNKDYESWKDSETSHWDFDDITCYFNKAKKWVPEKNISRCGSVKKGIIMVREDMAYATQLSDVILEAASELGYSLNNLNRKTNTGFMKPQLNINEFGKRWTSDQYLRLVNRNQNNLKVLIHSKAEKILLKNGFEAYGVEYQRHGRKYIALAKQEVIVSAGAVGSPKLLLLSGIGPEEVLKEANIRKIIDLPVGENLQDHVTTGLDLVLLEKSFFSFADLMLPSSVFQYFLHGRGPFATGLVESVGLVHSRLVDPLVQSPDLEFMILMAGLSSDKGIFLKSTMGITEKIWEEYFQPLINENVISMLPVLLHPKSKGKIKLDANNPKGKPIIDPRYLTEEEDVKTLVEGIRIIRKFVETRAMKDIGAKFNEKKFPGCEYYPFDSDDYWRCYISHLTLTVYHPVGTCKMASLKDKGVVDHRLRVHHTNKLRVIDASVMPTLPSANTNAAVIMIAEKGADLIKEDFRYRFSSCNILELLLKPDICY